MPRFIEGGCSITKINIFVNRTSSMVTHDYTAYAIYDQGSTKEKVQKLYSLSGATNDFKGILLTTIGITSFGIIVTVSLFVYARIIIRLVKAIFVRYIEQKAVQTYARYLTSETI